MGVPHCNLLVVPYHGVTKKSDRLTMVNQQAARTVQGFADGGRRRFVTASSGVQRKKVKPCGICPCCTSSTPPDGAGFRGWRTKAICHRWLGSSEKNFQTLCRLGPLLRKLAQHAARTLTAITEWVWVQVAIIKRDMMVWLVGSNIFHFP